MASNELNQLIAALSDLAHDLATQFRTKEKILYRFTETHSLARVGVALVLTCAVVGPVFYQYFGWAIHSGLVAAITVSFAIATMITAGLRTSIVVTVRKTTIIKKWFFVPYRYWSAREIGEVSYGGDWGKCDYPAGVVVRLGSNDIHIGSGKTMHELYTALLPLTK